MPRPPISVLKLTDLLIDKFLMFVLSTQSTNIREKLDFEMRMRDGAYKLLLACSKREQILNASKNLLICNARIKAYHAQLLREAEEDNMMAGRR